MSSCVLRNPRTTNELRANAVAVVDIGLRVLGVRIRRCRVGTNLPNSFDDILRTRPERNWKSFRRTQYKPVCV